jgi:hypothetical protein
MPEPTRPLLVIPTATPTAARNPGSPRGSKQRRPKKGRLVEKLQPRFAELQRALEARGAQLASSPDGFAPEQVVVFETTAPNARLLIIALKTTPALAWLADSELADLEPDEDFHFQDVKDRSKPLTARLFLVMANHAALSQLLSLWKQWVAAKRARLPDGYKSWGAAFGCLRDVRLWSARDRIEETGLREYWEECKSNKTTHLVEIELWSRPTSEDRAAASNRIRELVTSTGGTVKAETVIEQIRYHGLLAQLSATVVEGLFDDAAVDLLRCDDVHLFRPTPQQPRIALITAEDFDDDAVSTAVAPRASRPPTIALLDGLPLQNHEALRGHLIVDDPDGWEEDYPASCRRHGTAMASLVAHGDRSIAEDPPARPIYVRPILRPRTDLDGRPEEAPQDELWIDVVHRAVVRIFGKSSSPARHPAFV